MRCHPEDYEVPSRGHELLIGVRSTLVGRFIEKIYRAAGNTVVSANYLGDWGSQFALIATLWPQVKPSDSQWDVLPDSEKLNRITACYVDANKLADLNQSFRAASRETLAKMEHGLLNDETNEHLEFWRYTRELSLRHLEEFYKFMNVKFDATLFESDTVAAAHKMIEQMLERKVASVDSSGLTFALSDQQDNPIVLRKSDRTSLYLSRDLASLIERDSVYAADKYIYVVDHSQSHHFANLKRLASLMQRDDLAEKIEQVTFGRIHGLSTRKGKNEAVIDIVNRACELAASFIVQSKTIRIQNDEITDVARKLSHASIVVDELKRARDTEYTFTFENAFRMNQSNALLLEMKHSRLCSIEQRNIELMCQLGNRIDELDFEFGDEPCSKRILAFLHYLPELLQQSYEEMEPCRLTVYLLQLANLTGSAIANLRVSDQKPEVALPRLLLLSTVRKVLDQGMCLLGIEPLNRM